MNQYDQQADNNNGITVTIKSDESYGATWVIARGPDVGYVKSLLSQLDGDFSYVLGKAEASVKRQGDQTVNQARQNLSNAGVQTSTVEDSGAFYDQQQGQQQAYQPQQNYAPQNASQAPQQSPQVPTGNGPPACSHGPRKWAEGISKKTGNPYKGWFCQGPRNESCTPVFQN